MTEISEDLENFIQTEPKKKFCIDCKHYAKNKDKSARHGLCAITFTVALYDPVSGGRMEYIMMDAAVQRTGGHCSLYGDFWEEYVSEDVQKLRDSIKG